MGDFARCQVSGLPLHLQMRESSGVCNEEVELFIVDGRRQRVEIVVGNLNLAIPCLFERTDRIGKYART